MVAGVMAGLGTAGTAMDMSLSVKAGLPVYLLLAVASLAVAILWQSLMPAFTKPEALFLHYYRHVIGQLDGRSCPSYPVCSLYAAQAVEKHGLLVGSWLAMDRIIHEGDDLYGDRWVDYQGERRLYDPLSHNDFWVKGVRR